MTDEQLKEFDRIATAFRETIERFTGCKVAMVNWAYFLDKSDGAELQCGIDMSDIKTEDKHCAERLQWLLSGETYRFIDEYEKKPWEGTGASA